MNQHRVLKKVSLNGSTGDTRLRIDWSIPLAAPRHLTRRLPRSSGSAFAASVLQVTLSTVTTMSHENNPYSYSFS